MRRVEDIAAGVLCALDCFYEGLGGGGGGGPGGGGPVGVLVLRGLGCAFNLMYG